MITNNESRALYEWLTTQYTAPPIIGAARGTTKSTIVLAKQMEFFRAHIFLNRILNGEPLTKKDWENELQDIASAWSEKEEQDGAI